jgi:hypothetical protein
LGTVTGNGGTVTIGSGTLGVVVVVAGGGVDSTTTVGELVALGFGSGVGAAAGELFPPVAVSVSSAVTVVTRAPCTRSRSRAWCRARPEETCGNLDPGRDTAGSRGTRTTGELRSASRPWAEGEAGPRPNNTTAL